LQPDEWVVTMRINVKPRLLTNSNTSPGLLTSKGYPPTQSTTSRHADIPRLEFPKTSRGRPHRAPFKIRDQYSQTKQHAAMGGLTTRGDRTHRRFTAPQRRLEPPCA